MLANTLSPRHLEHGRAFPLVLFGIMALGLIFLFRDFVFSNLMLAGSDTISAGYFFRSFLVDSVRESGTLPVWNPYIFGGMPYIDAFHGDILYPLSSLKYIGDLHRTLGWNLILHIYMAGVFMYFTARQFGLSRLASAVSGIAYMFSGYLISLVAPGHDGKIFVTALFPLTLLFLDRGFHKKALLNFTLLGVVIGLIILTPHPQMAYFSLWAIAGYGAYLIIKGFLKSRSVVRSVILGGWLTYAVALGLGLSAIQFYPGYIYTKQFSPRADSKSGYKWATSWSLHTEDVVGLVAPEFAGTKANREKYPDVAYWSRNAFKDNSEYAGVVALFLGVIGAFFYRRKGIFFGGMALFALSYALADTTPLFKLYFYLIPNVSSLRAPSMIMFLFLFSVSTLAGMGVHWLTEEFAKASARTKKRLFQYVLGASGFVFLCALIWSVAGEDALSFYGSIFYRGLETETVAQGVTKWNLALANLPSIQSGFWKSFLLVGCSAGVIWLTTKGKAPKALLVALPLLIMVDGIRFNGRFVETIDHRRVFATNPVIEFLQRTNGNHRVFNGQVFSGDLLPHFGIEMVTGYHGNQLRWYDDLLGGPTLRNLGNGRFLNLVGARYLIMRGTRAFPQGHFGKRAVIIARDFGNVKVYENLNYFPRAFLVSNLEVIPDRRDIYPHIISDTTDLRKMAYVEELPDDWSNFSDESDSLDGAASTKDSAWVISSGANSIVVGYKATEDRALELTSSYYDAWKATMNETELPVFRINGAFMGMVVPAGEGTITLNFESSRYQTGKTITLISSILAILALVFAYFLMRKSPELQVSA